MKSCREYTYILVDNFMYINSDKSILTILYSLFFYSKPFPYFERETNNVLFNKCVPLFIIRLIRIIQFCNMYRIIKKSKSNLYNHKCTVKYNGHILLILRKGEYKIFNLRRKTVITLFNNSLNESEIEEKILTLKGAMFCDLTPFILKAEPKKKPLSNNILMQEGVHLT